MADAKSNVNSPDDGNRAAPVSAPPSALIRRVEEHVKKHMARYDPSHDWAHVDRVRRTAMRIAGTSSDVDLVVVELAALMHDLADAKYTADLQLSEVAAELLHGQVSPAQIDLILRIIPSVSYSSEMKMRAAGQWSSWQDGCLELHAVQDADRLDAVGAVGVLRCAAFSGARGRYLIEDAPGAGAGCEGHFYEKLLNVKDYMKTAFGKQEAERRQETMTAFLAALDKEREMWTA